MKLLLLATSLTTFIAPHAYAAESLLLVSTRNLELESYQRFVAQIEIEIARVNEWHVVQTQGISASLPMATSETIDIFTINRHEFQNAEQSKEPQARIIRELQRTLDTALIDAAIIIDCELLNVASANYDSCGLHYYDRTLARIKASSLKKFVVPLFEIKLWAAPLVTNLNLGLKGKAQEDERRQVASLMQQSQSSVTDDRSRAIFGRFGVGLIALEKSKSSSLNVGFGVHRESYYLALDTSFTAKRMQQKNSQVYLGLGNLQMISNRFGVAHELGIGFARFAPARSQSQQGVAIRWMSSLNWYTNESINLGVNVSGSYFHDPKYSAGMEPRYWANSVGAFVTFNNLFK